MVAKFLDLKNRGPANMAKKKGKIDKSDFLVHDCNRNVYTVISPA